MTDKTGLSRVRLLRDVRDEMGTEHRAGQLGWSSLRELSDGRVVVDFDGYERQRQAHAERLAQCGEGYNIVPWAGIIRRDDLEVLP